MRVVPAAAVVAVVAALLLVVLASHVTPSSYGHHHAGATVAPPSGLRSPVLTKPARVVDRPQKSKGLSFPLVVAVIVLAGVLVLALLWRAVLALRRRLRVRRRILAAAPVDHDFDAAAETLAQRLGEAADEGLDDLASGPVADAIIACWLRLEAVAASAGVALRASDTPAEVVLRVLSDDGVRAEPLRRLAELYREARFSRHVMDDVAREQARSALEAVRDDLGRSRSPIPEASAHG